MAKDYRPSLPFSVAMYVLKTTYIKSGGVRAPVIPEIEVFQKDGFLIYGSFKSYGGTEVTVDGVYSIEDTADVETWYRPDITSDCIVALADNPTAKYQIINDPENINRRNQFLKFKVKRIKGGV